MTSVNYPTTYPFVYPNLVPTPGPTYTHSFDGADRPIGLTDQNNYAAVSSVRYAPSNQLLSLNYFGASESRTYNTLGQLTNITIPGQLNVMYNYPTGTNNGKISSQYDAISGETVTYAHDSLNRLLSATGSGWSETYGYDAFGNLTSKTPSGGAPQLSIAVDPATNQIRQVQNLTYDNNGNELYGGVTYDAENRLLTAPGVEYGYDSKNKRVWKGTFDGNGNMTSQEAYFYGVDGQKLGTYALVFNMTAPIYFSSTTTNLNVFFGHKLLLAEDRLGSAGKYYPYGEARGTNPQDNWSFATYWRDSATQLDYADQRYYSNQFGRFMSPDRYVASAGPKDPGSWNRYAYTRGDPINRRDPSGLMDCLDCGDDGGGGGGIPWWLEMGTDDLAALYWQFIGPQKISSEQRKRYEDQIAAFLAAAWAAGASQSQGGQAYPKYLLVTDDSYTCFGHVVERDVTYELYDSKNQPIGGTITEHLFPTDYNAPVITQPGVNTSSSLPDGRFSDTISIQWGYPRIYDQTFTVSGSSVGLVGFINIPVYVQGFGGQYGVLHIDKTATYVDINGNRGDPRNCNP